MDAGEVLLALMRGAGWCLVAFLWQGALIAAAYALVRPLLPRRNPRYLAAMAALLAMLVWPCLTAWKLWHRIGAATDLGTWVVHGNAAAQPLAGVAAGPAWLAALLPWLVAGWSIGVAVLGVRVFRQWRALRSIVRAAERLPVWQDRARALGGRLGLRRVVRVLASVHISTPTLVGWVRPVVVVPLAMLARLPSEQVDLILAHELAHLRRFDHLANLFQVVLETVFFYHPAVHWLSREARNERELCCDALALRATGGRRRDFIAALAGLEDLRGGHGVLALAANGGVLAERAWFIAGLGHERKHPAVRTLAGACVAAVLALGLTVAWQHVAEQRAITRALATNATQLAHSIVRDVRVGAPEWVIDARRAPQRLAPLARVPLAAVKAFAPVDVRVDRPALQIAPLRAPLPALSLAMVDPQVAATTGLRAIRTEAPAYPAFALRSGRQGQVTVSFRVDANGSPYDLDVVGRSAGGVFDTAALIAMSHWRFAPPAQAGRAYRQTFSFRLDDRGLPAAAAGNAACVVSTGTHICRRAFDAAQSVQDLHPTR